MSYVKFLNSSEIVSASTDSQLKLWSIPESTCVRSFKGHVNEKNFVGLASNCDFITCGSENNSLYVYYKGLPQSMLHFHFDSAKVIRVYSSINYSFFLTSPRFIHGLITIHFFLNYSGFIFIWVYFCYFL